MTPPSAPPFDPPSSTRGTWPRMTVGVAVFSRADKRAFEIGLKSIATQTVAPDEVVVFDQQTGARKPFSEVEIMERVGVGVMRQGLSHDNVRNQALARLGDHDVVALVCEGTVLARDAIEAERRRFSERRALLAALRVSPLYVPHRRLPPDAMAREATEILDRFAFRRRAWASRYHSPAMLVAAPRRGLLPRFETFAQRSEWAAGRMFLDAAAKGGETETTVTDAFGQIGGAPDRRGGREQGEICCDALFRLATAHPRYRSLASSDLRRLFAEQSIALLFEPGRRTTSAFLSGMLGRVRREFVMNRRLARDIRNLG